jgi:hypothetical protein
MAVARGRKPASGGVRDRPSRGAVCEQPTYGPWEPERVHGAATKQAVARCARFKRSARGRGRPADRRRRQPPTPRGPRRRRAPHTARTLRTRDPPLSDASPYAPPVPLLIADLRGGLRPPHRPARDPRSTTGSYAAGSLESRGLQKPTNRFRPNAVRLSSTLSRTRCARADRVRRSGRLRGRPAQAWDRASHRSRGEVKDVD